MASEMDIMSLLEGVKSKRISRQMTICQLVSQRTSNRRGFIIVVCEVGQNMKGLMGYQTGEEGFFQENTTANNGLGDA